MKTKEQTENDSVCCVMSGDFVQRGEPAIFSKFSRAAAAVRGGADLVIELPLPWSLSSAEAFARGGVQIIEALGCSAISFGSECGDIEALKKLRDENNLRHGEIVELLKNEPGLSYPAARARILSSELLSLPNNSLALEYLKAANIECITVKRENQHDGPSSAKEIREELRAMGLGVDYRVLEIGAVSRLRMFERDYFCTLPDSSNGRGIRLYDAVREFDKIDSICHAAKSRGTTLSSVRRLLWCAALGIEEGMNSKAPPYARVLAFNERGRKELSAIKKSAAIPVLTNPSAVNKLNEYAKKVFAADASAHDLYSLGLKEKNGSNCGNDYRIGPYIV